MHVTQHAPYHICMHTFMWLCMCVRMHTCKFESSQVIDCVSPQGDSANVQVGIFVPFPTSSLPFLFFLVWVHNLNMGRLTIDDRLQVITLFSRGYSVYSIRKRLIEEIYLSLQGIFDLKKKFCSSEKRPQLLHLSPYEKN